MLAATRRQELDGFIEDLFNGEGRIDLPERPHVAVGYLSDRRAIMAGVEDLVAGDAKYESRTEFEATFKHLRELTSITELEIHDAVQSHARTSNHMLASFPTRKPTVY